MPNEKIDFEIDILFDNIEKMIDAQDDMWEEEKYSNYREVIKIKEERYIPAKKEARIAFEKSVKEIVREMFRNRIKSRL